MSFLINDFQGSVDILKLRCQYRKVSADIRGYFFPAMNTFIFFDVGSNLFGNGKVVAENVAKNTFHKVGFRSDGRSWGLPVDTNIFLLFKLRVKSNCSPDTMND